MKDSSTVRPDKGEIMTYRDEVSRYLREQLLPFWLTHGRDDQNGGFITHFDAHGIDTGEDEKSLIAQSRILHTFSSALRAGYDPSFRGLADHAAAFLMNRLRDETYGGFFWMTNRAGEVVRDDKVLYGHSFAIYALSEYALVTGERRAGEMAEYTFDLIQSNCVDVLNGGYYEVFNRQWVRSAPGSAGGDRKTLDAHMHLMEAFTTLYEYSRLDSHRRRLLEVIELLLTRMLHKKNATGIPQFTPDWRPVEQIKFDIVWGWDRFRPDGVKRNPLDNTSYGHNVELAWLMMHALDVLGVAVEEYRSPLERMLAHAAKYGIDREFGGVYVEGSHEGPAHDLEKEFWQQCEVMIGMADAYRRFGDPVYWEAYKAVHRFLFDYGVNPSTGELWPLLTREGGVIWNHTSHSWKINYHSVRAMIRTVEILDDVVG